MLVLRLFQDLTSGRSLVVDPFRSPMRTQAFELASLGHLHQARRASLPGGLVQAGEVS